MAKIIVYNQEREPLEASSVFIFDSTGKKLGGLSTNSSGQGTINDSILQDKNGRIEVTRVGYEPTRIKVSDFGGVAYLKRKEQVIGDVVIVRKKPKPPQPSPQPPQPKPKKKKNTIGFVIGGLGLGIIVLALLKMSK